MNASHANRDTIRLPQAGRRAATMIAAHRQTESARAGSKAATQGTADWLCLAAAPTFAIMALLISVLDGGSPTMLCSATHAASPLGGMVPMYLLMSAFHLAPWLKLISGRRSGRRPS